MILLQNAYTTYSLLVVVVLTTGSLPNRPIRVSLAMSALDDEAEKFYDLILIYA